MFSLLLNVATASDLTLNNPGVSKKAHECIIIDISFPPGVALRSRTRFQSILSKAYAYGTESFGAYLRVLDF